MRKDKWLDRTLVRGPYLCLCLSESEYNKALDYIGVEKTGRQPWLGGISNVARTHEVKAKNGAPAHIVCFRPIRGASVAFNYGSLAHEATHVWQWFCEHIGEESPSLEFEAYSIQSIFTALLEEYLTRKRKK